MSGMWRRGAPVALAGALAAGAAQAADPAGAAALEGDLNAFFAALAETLAIEIAPAAPVKVVVAGDAYRAEVRSVTVTGDEPAADGEAEIVLTVEPFTLLLHPDNADPDLTGYAVESLPGVVVTVGGERAMELSADVVSYRGVWSDALDMPLNEATAIENMRIDISPGLLEEPDLPLFFALVIGRLETDVSATRHGSDAWRVASSVVLDGVDVFAAGALGTVDRPLDPETGMQAVQHYDHVESRMTLSSVPLAAWRDFALEWFERLSALGGVPPEDPDALVRDFLLGLPALPDKIDFWTLAEGIASESLSMERQEQNLQVTGLTSDVLTLHQQDRGSGIRLAHVEDTLLERIAPLVPTSYDSDLEVRNLPVGHAWRALMGTIDAWLGDQDPDAAAGVFLRSFADLALSVGSSVNWEFSLDWPVAHFDLDLALAVSETAVRTVVGTIDGAFSGMTAFGERIAGAAGPEVASGWAMLQAFGQREQAADGGDVVTRYLVEIDEAGHVTFNGQDYDVVFRMIEESIEDGMDAFQFPLLPTPD